MSFFSYSYHINISICTWRIFSNYQKRGHGQVVLRLRRSQQIQTQKRQILMKIGMLVAKRKNRTRKRGKVHQNHPRKLQVNMMMNIQIQKKVGLQKNFVESCHYNTTNFEQVKCLIIQTLREVMTVEVITPAQNLKNLMMAMMKTWWVMILIKQDWPLWQKKNERKNCSIVMKDVKLWEQGRFPQPMDS